MRWIESRIPYPHECTHNLVEQAISPVDFTPMDQARIQFQRDFYHLLLRLASDHLDLQTTLSEALSLIADITDAEQAYLEVTDAEGEIVYQYTDIPEQTLSDIRESVSSGIIAEAIKTKEILLIPSALLDPRFESQESVQRLAIESVLCVPFFGSRTKGVLYLRGDKGFKDAAEKIQLDADLFAQHVSPLLDQLLKEQESLGKSPAESLRAEHNLEGVIGESPTFIEALQSALMIAPLEVNTLLLGETGTGKTQIARVIHNNSHRKDGPFVEVNCAALPDTLIENELFGAVAGAHSSANKDTKGKIAAASGGTLFLDEIGELPIESQAKLLQFIQSGEYYPLGSSEIHRADTRLVFATNQNLKEKTLDRTFREDLYFRINTFEIEMPPLAKRKTDIALLARHFLEEVITKNRLSALELGEQALTVLTEANIPGNVRGLQNLIEKVAINCTIKKDSLIAPLHLPDLAKASPNNSDTDFHTATLAFQRKLLQEKLSETSWNISRTSRELSLSRSHVHNLINQFQLSR